MNGEKLKADDLVERLNYLVGNPSAWSEGFDDGISDAIREATARIIAVEAERDALAKDLAAQIAGHQETARQGTEALMRANTATAKLGEAEGRARKHWQAFCDLREDIIGHGPMCRDCADFNGRCQGSGPPCDPDEAVKEQIANWRTSQALAALIPKTS